MKTTIIALALAAAVSASGKIYPASTVVVDTSSDAVSFQTATGHIYQISGAEDWQTGDVAALLMYDSGTDDVTDDIIVCARYSGTLDALTGIKG